MSLSIKDLPRFTGEGNERAIADNFRHIKLASDKAYYTSTWGTFSNLITAIGSDEAVVYVNSTVTLAANLTIPENISVHDGGGKFAFVDEVLTINRFEWGLGQAFEITGSGSVSLNSKLTPISRPEWWGLNGTDDTDAVQAAINAITEFTSASPVNRGYSRGTVILSTIYPVTDTIEVINKFGFCIRGAGSKRQTGIVWTGATSSTAVVFETSNIYYCSFSNFSIDGNNKAGITHRLDNLNIPGSANSYSIGTHENFWTEVMFLGSTEIACQIGYSGNRPGSVLINNQIDWCYWTNCHFSSAKKLVQVEGSNSFHFYFRGGEANDFTGHGFYLLNGGQLHLNGAGLSCGGTPGAAPVGVYFYRGTSFGTLTVTKCQQEGNALTLEAPDDSGSANISPILFSGNNFGYTGATELALTAYKVVDFRQRGYFESRGDKWGMNPTNSVKGQLYFAVPGSAGGNVKMDGLQIVSTECEVVTSGNTLVSGFSKSGILSAMVSLYINTVGRTVAGLSHFFQMEKVGQRASMMLSTNSDEAPGSTITGHKSRGTIAGAHTIVQDGDSMLMLQGVAADGVDSEAIAAYINLRIDGTPGSNDVPGGVEIGTSPDGSASAIKRWFINNLGKLIGYDASGSFKMHLDPINGKIQIGNATSRTIGSNNGQMQIEGVSAATAISLIRNSNDAVGPVFNLGKTRSTAAGTNTIVQNGDLLGTVNFIPADGSDLDGEAAQIRAVVDGTPGANDIPGRLIFGTTRDGGNGVNDALEIDSKQVFFVHNCEAAPSSSPAGGGQLYVESGALKYRGSSGTITTLGVA